MFSEDIFLSTTQHFADGEIKLTHAHEHRHAHFWKVKYERVFIISVSVDKEDVCSSERNWCQPFVYNSASVVVSIEDHQNLYYLSDLTGQLAHTHSHIHIHINNHRLHDQLELLWDLFDQFGVPLPSTLLGKWYKCFFVIYIGPVFDISDLFLIYWLVLIYWPVFYISTRFWYIDPFLIYRTCFWYIDPFFYISTRFLYIDPFFIYRPVFYISTRFWYIGPVFRYIGPVSRYFGPVFDLSDPLLDVSAPFLYISLT